MFILLHFLCLVTNATYMALNNVKMKLLTLRQRNVITLNYNQPKIYNNEVSFFFKVA